MLLSVSEMYLEPNAKTLLRMLKIQHPRVGFESHMKRIQILISECLREDQIRILVFWIRILIP